MPAAYLMSWEPKARRWWKMDAGTRFVVSVRQLRTVFNEPSIPETKEGSYQWANRWWERRQSPTTTTLEYHDFDTGEPTGIFVEVSQEEIDYQAQRRADRRRQVRAIIHPVKVPLERTVGALAARYLDTLMSRHKAGEISVGEYANAKSGLWNFRDFVGAGAAVESINPERWQSYYDHLISPDGPKSIISRRKNWRYARNFLQWLDDLDLHPAPKNLNRRQYRFKGGAKSVPTTPTETIKEVINKATGQLRLHLLLMLNCGFTQQDISDLHPSEIDWEHGRIRRKRSKTGDYDKVPTIDYLLWSETFSLLKQYRSDNQDHVLLTERGKAWMRDDIHADGSRSRTDAIQSCYRHLDVEGKPPLKQYRKASATLMDGSPEHGRYAIHFLGHAPTDIAHTHYISQNGPSFDAAVKWLAEQYGF